ncbi:MAG TPA: Ig-like domain-containing protein, partial [Pyrinomonadaceae bacterium]
MIIRPFISRPSTFSTWLQQKHHSRSLRRTVLHFCLPLLFLTAFILQKTSGPVSFLRNANAAPFSGTPYTGTAINLPGRIEVENYDNGGEGVAYHDTTATNDGGAYRAEGVDVCTCGSPYGLSVGWTQPGEWMEYTVTVSSYGVYKFQTLTATTVSGSALHVEVDGVNVTGQMTLPNTGAWASYVTSSSPAVTLTAGQHIVRVAVDVSGFLIDSVDLIRLNTPYGGTATALPGTIPAENFDNGGEGIAYHDTTIANEGGAYRSEGVDLCACGNSDGAALGWSQVGEWTRYTVNVSTTDTYTLQARMSTITNGCAIHLEVDGVNVTGQMALPNTGAWDAWTTISKPNVQIPAGQHDVKLVIEGTGFLLDSLSAIPSLPIGPSALTANAVSTSQINLAWTNNSFNESGFKIERKTGTSGTYSEITTTAAGIMSFNDTGRQPSTQYFYRVRATNLGGDSAYSNEASAMTSNVLPSVSVTAPSGGSVFTAPANITLNASASDADGTVSKVEFFQGSTKLGEDLTAPYSFSWTNVTAGSYSITAKATDNVGGVTTSAPVAITVNALPTVSQTAPAANTVFTSPANFTITASASDSDGSISKVEFFAGAGLLGQDTSAPYSFTMSNASHGTYVLTAKATDNNGGVTTSGAVSAIVTDAPTTSITSPANNAVLTAGANIAISAAASDDGTVAKVEFLKNGVVLGEDTTSPYNVTWNNVPAGSYALTTRVTDDLGVTAISSAVNINVIAPSGISRLDPMNRTGSGGEDPLSRNFNWTLPLVNLPGRAGMDLSLSLSYNSLVWTRTSNYISFDDDHGFPSPGFRLGFPVIQQQYFNAEVGKDAYLLIGTDGSRTELRRVGASTLFEAADSSHLLLDASTMILRSTDGTQMSYSPVGTDFSCTQIKDRNGNYITINYASGQITDIHDTLDRVITFNYENGLLSSITQTWKKPSDSSQTITHTWASFAYADLQIQTNFNGLAIIGAVNGATKKVLSKVTLDDNSTTPAQNSHFDFDYTSWGQVWKISNFAADDHLLNYRSYNLPQTAGTAQSDCPRFTERRDFAEKWNQNSSGIEQEAVTTFTAPQSGTASVPGQSSQSATVVQITNRDQTFTKMYFLGTAGTSSGWRVGLPYLVESYDVNGTIPERQVATTWTQDDETKSFIINPRVLETNIYDRFGKHKRTELVYQPHDLGNGITCQLPQDVREYDANATTILRTTRTIYIDDSPYLSRWIIGLPKERLLYEGDATSGVLRSRLVFKYDDSQSIDGNDTPVQHDPGYSSSFVSGRGNLSSVERYNVDNLTQFTTSSMKYNTAGAIVSSKDALNHETRLSYIDAFSDEVSRNTLAYATKLTDPDGYYSTLNYNFDFGALTYRQTPPPNFNGPASQQPLGPEQSFEYYDHGRLKKELNLVNGAYSRFEYDPSGIRVDTYVTIEEGQGEAHSFQIFDGAQQSIATVNSHPGSAGGYAAQRAVYDVMGRVIKTSNPTETTALGNDPNQWTPTGDDATWIYTEQTYDWKGRPLVTTNQDATNRTVSYTGCGCAGG